MCHICVIVLFRSALSFLLFLIVFDGVLNSSVFVVCFAYSSKHHATHESLNGRGSGKPTPQERLALWVAPLVSCMLCCNITFFCCFGFA